MSRWLLLLASALALGNAAAVEVLSLTPAQVQALGIGTEPVAGQSKGRAAGYPAQVKVPNAQMRIVSAPVGGMIEMLAVAPGTPVRRGQVLAHLASPQALELQRDALQSGSQSALQQQNLKRDEQLFAEGLIPESRLQASRAAASQANAMASERRQGLALAGIAPGKLGGPLNLVSPIDGVVLEQGVQLGQRVDASAMVFTLAKLSPLWLEIQTPIAVASELRPGATVRIPQGELTGKIIAIGRAVDTTSQTVLVRAVVDKGADRLTPGQAVEVEFDGNVARGIQLPAGALLRHDGQRFVFVQTRTSDAGVQFAVRPVSILAQGSDGITVEGVKPGEIVVTKGVSGLKALYTGVGKE